MEEVEIKSDAKKRSASDGATSSNSKPKPRARKKSGTATEVNKLRTKVAALEEERDELKDLLLRKAAEFDNFKRRNENEQVQLVVSANARLITELLPA